MKPKFLRVSLALLAVSGCDEAVVGNGQPAQDNRSLSGFTQVANHGSLDVKVTQGASFAVVVHADSNLMPIITTTVVNGVLAIEVSKSYRSNDPVEVDVTLPTFTGADNEGSGLLAVTWGTAQAIALADHGSGKLTFAGQAGAVSADLSGSGAISLTGTGASLTGSIGGSGLLDASQFPVGGATFSCNGSGAGKLTVNGNATLSVAGSGSIQATLNGGVATFSVSGSGSIDWSGSSTVGTSSVTGSGSINHH